MPLFRFCPRCGREMPAPEGPTERIVYQECSACGAFHYRNAKPTASGLLVRNGKLLLGRRAVNPFRGWWHVPGGFLEPWEHPEEGVARELLEETGLRVRPTEQLGLFMDTYAYGNGTDYTLNLYYLVEQVESGEPIAADDIAELRFFAAHELPERIAFETGRAALAAWRRRVDESTRP